MAEEFDFISIGDIVTDEFIELNKDNADVCVNDKGRKRICMNFGDKLEYNDAVTVPAVGNSPNAATSAKRLGLKTALITDIGDDKGGTIVKDQLTNEGIDQSFVRVHEGKSTNFHYVLRYGPERTILIKHEDYEYTMPDVGSPKWLYFSSVGENSLAYHHEIAAYVKAHPETKLAFQPGSFQIKLGYETLKDIYEACELFFCNREEAMQILKTDDRDIKGLMQGMHDLGVARPIITDGPDGAYALDDGVIWHMPMYPDPAPPVDRTGAGDSFSSTFTSALALGKSTPEALSWGPINSMSVVQHIGAQKGLLTRDELLKYLENAPEHYVATEVQ